MLNLVLGRKQTGKTGFCLKAAEQAVSEEKSVIMLIPEQYSFECQRYLLNTLGPVVSNKIQIYSFTGLCSAIRAVYGGFSGRTVDEGTRFILAGEAVHNVRDSLRLYPRYADSPSFAMEMTDVISELKRAHIGADKLAELAETVAKGSFKDKLHDISLIVSAYDALLDNSFIEPLDLITKTAERMTDNSFFSGKTVFIDEFKGFTESQYVLLDRIIQSADIYASFCIDSLTETANIDVFGNVRASARRLQAIAKFHGIETRILRPEHFANSRPEELIYLEEFLSESRTDAFSENAETVTVCKAKTMADEADFCMSTIHRLVRCENRRYRDFVIISRKSEAYSRLLEKSARDYGIPCFTDNPVSVLSLPLSVFVISAIKAVNHFATADILRFLKTGLTEVSENEISLLENYCYIWSIDGKKWSENWSMNISGLKSTESDDSGSEEINRIREKVFTVLSCFKKRFAGSTADMCTAVMRLLEDCNTVNALKEYTEKLEKSGKMREADYERAGYDVFIGTLDKLIDTLGETTTATRFADCLKSALGFETVGAIPQTLDEVMFGTADRIRPFRPKCVFIVGAALDEFPSGITDSGLFSRSERSVMNDNGISVSDHSIDDYTDERFMFYNSVCSASDRVFISYSEQRSDGTKNEPAVEFLAIKNTFLKCNYLEYGYNTQPDEFTTEAEQPAFQRFMSALGSDCNMTAALKEYFSGSEKYKGRLNTVEMALSTAEPSLSPKNASALYGNRLDLSASKIDDFCGCKFMYFCKYGLGARKPQKVDFDAMTKGNIIHYVLEAFINAHKSDIGTLDNDTVRLETDALCDQYIANTGTDTSDLGDRFRYMLSALKSTAAYIACALNNEFAQSDFKPAFCELKIGEDSPVKSVSSTTNGGVEISINGSIDRVDTSDDGRVRVIDYKTGIKEFKLSQVLSGQNMQMLIYLYSVVKNGRELLNADIPAGVLYFPAKKEPSLTGTGKYIKMNGLIDSEPDTVEMMEKGSAGNIVPARLRPGGKTFFSTESLVSVEGFSVIFKYLDAALKNIGESIMNGNIGAFPVKTGDSRKCDYCDYCSICKLENEDIYFESKSMKTADTLAEMLKETGGDAE